MWQGRLHWQAESHGEKSSPIEPSTWFMRDAKDGATIRSTPDCGRDNSYNFGAAGLTGAIWPLTRPWALLGRL